MNDTRSSFLEFVQAFLLLVLSLIGTILFVYLGESYTYKKEQQRLEFLAKQKELDRVQSAVSAIGVWTFTNKWEVFDGIIQSDEYRDAEKLEPGVEYYIGALRQFDRDQDRGFDNVYVKADDDMYYQDPIFTVSYAGWICVSYSIDSEGGWLAYGETQRGTKTGNVQYVPADEQTNSLCEGYGERLMSFRVPINGLNGLDVGFASLEVSPERRHLNERYEERLGDVYSNVPEEYADRTRTVWVSHVTVEGWSVDPEEHKAERLSGTKKPDVTLKLKLRSYGSWNLTEEEYTQLSFDVSEFGSWFHRDFSPYSTVELIA